MASDKISNTNVPVFVHQQVHKISVAHDVFIASLARPVGRLWPKLPQKPYILDSRVNRGTKIAYSFIEWTSRWAPGIPTRCFRAIHVFTEHEKNSLKRMTSQIARLSWHSAIAAFASNLRFSALEGNNWLRSLACRATLDKRALKPVSPSI